MPKSSGTRAQRLLRVAAAQAEVKKREDALNAQIQANPTAHAVLIRRLAYRAANTRSARAARRK